MANNMKEYFNNQIVQKLEPLESKRKAIISAVPVILVISTLTLLVLVYVMVKFLEVSSVISISMAILGLILSFFLHNKIKKNRIKNFIKEYKNEISTKIFEFYNQEIDYKPNDNIPKEEYYGSNLFFEEVDSYKGDDLISFKFHNTDISFSNLQTTVNKNNQSVQEFNGIFFKAIFEQDFQGKVIIIEDLQFERAEFEEMQLFLVEDENFSKNFTVFCNDHTLASNILHQSFIQRVLELKERLGINIRISFVNSKFYLAAFYEKNSFELDIQKSLLEYENIAKDVEIFESLLQIVDDLSLNEEFWLTPANLQKSDYEKDMLSLI